VHPTSDRSASDHPASGHRASGHPVITPLPGGGDLGLVDALAQLTFAVHAALARIAASHDLSIAALRLLGILRDRRPAINELARLLQLDKSSVTGLVDRAQERGLVRRTASPLDRRSVQVTITAAGQELIDLGTAAFETEVAALVADLTASQRSRLSTIASLVVAADARRRGIDILSVQPAAAEATEADQR
jgi:MarR family transcriptional regulator, lower aerobic nicotinate degradation pathway regulator